MSRTTISPKLDDICFGEALPYLQSIPDASVDLIVSSPPYNIGKEYETKQSLDTYLAAQAVLITELCRTLKETGSIFWQVGSFPIKGQLIPLDIKFYPIFEKLGMQIRNRIIWIRQHGLHATKKFSPRHETMLWFTKSTDYKFNLDAIRVPQKYQDKKHYREGAKKGELSCHPDGKNPGDIWLFRNVKHNHEEQTIHPCQFPEDMISRVLLATTDVGDTVLDPFMGVGTVAVVARDHKRHYLGAETDRDYFETALQRIAGTPDKNNCFPNLKTLRQYIARTGQSAEKFRFAVQIGQKASLGQNSKIFSEEYHKEELDNRLSYEEAAFASRVNGGTAPERTITPKQGRLEKSTTADLDLFATTR